jgi:deoxyribose-phosphate aldolase
MARNHSEGLTVSPAELIAGTRIAMKEAGAKVPSPRALARRDPVDGEPEEAPPDPAKDKRALAACIDHTLLRPEAGGTKVMDLCEQANEHGFRAVCVNSAWVSLAAAMVEPPVRVCAVVGFPFGATGAKVKAFEATTAIGDGAHEIDVVMQIGRLIAAVPEEDAGIWDTERLKDVQKELASVVSAVKRAKGPVPVEERKVKVIIETNLLDDRRKVAASLLAVGAGAQFVKTCTGFLGNGATPEDVALIRETLGEGVGIKASGGIRDREVALGLLAAGANLLGCSASVDILGAS